MIIYTLNVHIKYTINKKNNFMSKNPYLIKYVFKHISCYK